MTKKYGLHMLVTTDPAVKEHMANILKQVEGTKDVFSQDKHGARRSAGTCSRTETSTNIPDVVKEIASHISPTLKPPKRQVCRFTEGIHLLTLPYLIYIGIFVEWLMVSKVEKLILAVKSKETMAVLERWQFDIRNEKDDPSFTNNGASPSGSRTSAPPKTEQQIQEEIQAIMRQITACVTFLPMLDGKCKEEPRYSFHYCGN